MLSKTPHTNILMASAEIAPLAKVGGLADVVGALPKALVNQTSVSLIMPFYTGLLNARQSISLVKKNISLELGHKKQRFDLYRTYLPNTKIVVYLVKHSLLAGKAVYNATNPRLDIERFILFSKAVVAAIADGNFSADIIHCHDWHTALIPCYIDEYHLRYHDFPNIKTILTIHNLASQGIAGLDILDYANLDKKLNPALLEDYYDQDNNIIDILKVGILSADLVTTVSQTYAQEILGKEYGCGLESYLQRRRRDLYGIVNGIDTIIFNPQTDKNLFKRYNKQNFVSGKLANKQALQKKLKLPLNQQPLLAMVTRLVEQKGFDILLSALDTFLEQQTASLVILGTGNPVIERALQSLAKKYPDQLSLQLGFDAKLAQVIYAASDFFLMPSYFEPCGLGQMIAMRYGSLPVVRATGGLKDTVIHYKNGLVFTKYNSADLLAVLNTAVKLYGDKKRLHAMTSQAMSTDWSWTVSAKQYLKLYNKLK